MGITPKKERLAGHWWQPDSSGLGMTHKASKETVLYREDVGEGWHLFEYRWREIAYPLFIRFKTIEYPAPHPGSYEFLPQQVSYPDKIKAHIWLLDHGRSMHTWSSDDQVPYGIWHLADVAMREAAMLWDEMAFPIQAADDFCVKEGFLNGRWRRDLYRRFDWCEQIQDYMANGYYPGMAKQLPIAAFGEQSSNRKMPEWYAVPRVTFDAWGAQSHGETIGWRNRTNGMRVGRKFPISGKWPEGNVGWRMGGESGNGHISFRRPRYDEKARYRFYDPVLNGWDAAIWAVGVHNELTTIPAGVKIDETTSVFSHKDPGWKVFHDMSEDMLRARYDLARMDIEIWEHAAPCCQPLIDTDPIEGYEATGRQVDIDSYPIGGKFGGRLSIRRSIVPTADAPIEEWLRSFDGL